MKILNDDILYDIDNSINNELTKHRIQQEKEKLDYEKQYYIKEIEKLVDSIEEQERHIKEANYEIKRLNNIINELEKYLEEEKDRLAGETSTIYEDSLGKTRLVNEDIFNEIIIIQDKIKALKGDSSDEIH